MTLAEWLSVQKRGSVTDLSRKSGVSMLTIRRVRDGMRLRNTRVANALSEATAGAVPAGSMLDIEPVRGAA